MSDKGEEENVEEEIGSGGEKERGRDVTGGGNAVSPSRKKPTKKTVGYTRNPMECGRCGKELSHPSHMSDHMKSCLKMRELVCTVLVGEPGHMRPCGKTSRIKSAWKTHVSRVHGKDLHEVGQPLYVYGNKERQISAEDMERYMRENLEHGTGAAPKRGRPARGGKSVQSGQKRDDTSSKRELKKISETIPSSDSGEDIFDESNLEEAAKPAKSIARSRSGRSTANQSSCSAEPPEKRQRITSSQDIIDNPLFREPSPSILKQVESLEVKAASEAPGKVERVIQKVVSINGDGANGDAHGHGTLAKKKQNLEGAVASSGQAQEGSKSGESLASSSEVVAAQKSGQEEAHLRPHDEDQGENNESRKEKSVERREGVEKALLNEESVEQGEEKVASKGNVEHEEEVQIVGEVCKTQHDEGGVLQRVQYQLEKRSEENEVDLQVRLDSREQDAGVEFGAEQSDVVQDSNEFPDEGESSSDQWSDSDEEEVESSDDELPSMKRVELQMAHVLHNLINVAGPPERYKECLNVLLNLRERDCCAKYNVQYRGEWTAQELPKAKETETNKAAMLSYITAIGSIRKDVKDVEKMLLIQAKYVEDQIRDAYSSTKWIAKSERHLAQDARKNCEEANLARNKARKDNALMTDELEKANSCLEQMSKEVDKLKSQAASPQEIEAVASLKKQVETSEAAIKEKDKFMKELSEKLLQSETEMGTLIEGKKELVNKCKGELAEKEKAFKEKEGELEKLREMSEKMKEETQKKDDYLAEFRKQSEEKEQGLQDALATSQTEAGKVREKFENLEKEKNENAEAFRLQVEEYKKKLEGKEAILSSRVSDLKEVRTHFTRVNDLNAQLVQQKKELDSDIKLERKETERLRSNNQKLNENLEQARGKLKLANSKLRDLDTRKKRHIVDKEMIRVEKEFALAAANPEREVSKNEIVIKTVAGAWNYQEIIMCVADGKCLMEMTAQTEGAMRMIVYELLQNLRPGEKGIIADDWYTFNVDLFRFINEADFMMPNFKEFLLDLYPEIDLGEFDGEGRLVIVDNEDEDKAQQEEQPCLQQVYGRNLLHASKPAWMGTEDQWGLLEMKQDFEHRYKKYVAYAVETEIENNKIWGRENDWFARKGALLLVTYSEHWVLLAFVNGPKLNDRDRDAWKQLFKDNRAITITVDGPRFEECTVDLSKPCFILVDSALEYDLAVKCRVIECHREFLYQHYEAEVKAKGKLCECPAQWKSAPCYVAKYMQQVGDATCGLHVARVLETLLKGESFDDKAVNMEIYSEKWYSVYLQYRKKHKANVALDKLKQMEEKRTEQEEANANSGNAPENEELFQDDDFVTVKKPIQRGKKATVKKEETMKKEKSSRGGKGGRRGRGRGSLRGGRGGSRGKKQ